MSRGSIRTFLLVAKRHLHQTIKNKDHVSFVIGNESADLDSIASALLYGYLESSQIQAKRSGKVLIPITNIPAADLSLRPELTALLQHADIQPSELITLDDLSLADYPREKTSWTLVDHNLFLGALGTRFIDRVTGVIDHHDDEQRVPASASPRLIAKSGSCSSLIANHFRGAWDALSAASSHSGAAHGQDDRLVDDAAYTSTWDAQAATLALGAILSDTANLRDEHKTTEHDRRAVRDLEARVYASPRKGKEYDRDRLFAEIDAAKMDLDGLSVWDILRKDYKVWTEGDLTLGTAAVVRPLEYLWEKEGREKFNETLVRFAEERSLGLLLVVTAYTQEDESFARQILLVASAEGKETAERFVKDFAGGLELEDLSYAKPADMQFGQAWDQKNLAASRKQVAPLLRKAMRGSKVPSKY